MNMSEELSILFFCLISQPREFYFNSEDLIFFKLCFLCKAVYSIY